MDKQGQNYLKTGDNVVVISGKEKGKTGTIIRVLRDENRVVIGGVNIVKRHQRPVKMGDEAGIVNKEAPLHVSNVMLADPKTGKPTRVGRKTLENGKKVRFSKKSGDVIDS